MTTAELYRAQRLILRALTCDCYQCQRGRVHPELPCRFLVARQELAELLTRYETLARLTPAACQN